MYRSSRTKRPRRPLVPEVVATMYFPWNRCPIRSGSSLKARTFSYVMARSATQSSKCPMSFFLSVTGSSVGSSIRSGRPR